MAIGLGSKRTKLDASPQQPPASAKDQSPNSFKRVTMGIKRGSSNFTSTKKRGNNGVNVY